MLRASPFSACHNHVKVDSGFIQDCEYDVCACKDHPLSCLCEEYSAYVTTCSLVGVNFQWKHLPQFKECGRFLEICLIFNIYINIALLHHCAKRFTSSILRLHNYIFRLDYSNFATISLQQFLP